MRLFFMPSSDIPHPEEAGRAQAWTGVSKDARCLCSATRTLLRRLGRLRPGAGRHVDLAAHQLARGPEGAGGAQGDAALAGLRSEARRVGKSCVSTCRFRGAAVTKKKKKNR